MNYIFVMKRDLVLIKSVRMYQAGFYEWAPVASLRRQYVHEFDECGSVIGHMNTFARDYYGQTHQKYPEIDFEWSLNKVYRLGEQMEQISRERV